MIKFSIFVDGSNQIGSLKKMNIEVDDYEKFYRFIFEESVKVWATCFLTQTSNIGVLLHRIYWYAVGSIDNLNLDDSKLISNLEKIFHDDKQLKRNYMALISQQYSELTQKEKSDKAWDLCLSESKKWYTKQKELVDGFHKFYHSLRSEIDFMEVSATGHWKVDLLNRVVQEKGLDTQLAVDMVALKDTYDVGIVISGDADSIPSINYVKHEGKHIGVVDFIKGHPPEDKGRQFSSRLKAASDFVVPIYELDLVKKKLVKKK